ncbi:MAG: cation:proton antiporter [bacterium]|nr:cation:proton antiporter [bacterium]
MRIIRLVGAALVVVAICALTGSGVLDNVRPLSFLSTAMSQALETGSAQALLASTGETDRLVITAADPTDVGHNAEGVEVAVSDSVHEVGLAGLHANPVVPVLALLLIVILVAKLGGNLMNRIGQPGVLGQLIFGIILGNLTLMGITWIDSYLTNIALGTLTNENIIAILAEIGALLLLFKIGLDSKIKEVFSIGLSSVPMIALGVIAPFLLGWGVGAWLLPDESILVHIILGVTLCATSAGITGRVISNLNRFTMFEGRVVQSGAVVGNLIGLMILAVVAGLVAISSEGGGLTSLAALILAGKAVLFLGIAILIGKWCGPLLSRLNDKYMLLTASLSILFLFSFIANKVGLAALVGAFAAGLTLDSVQFKDSERDETLSLRELLLPLSGFLVPIFFVYMGFRVNLGGFAEPRILGLVGALTGAAILGKLLCSLGVVEKGLDRLSIGIGMIPSGEIGLVFASIGAGLMISGQPVLSESTFGAIVTMIFITTLLTPPVLKWSLNRPRGYEGASDAEMARIAAERRQKRKDYYRNRASQDGRDGDRDRGRGRGRDRGGRGRSRSGEGRGDDNRGRGRSGDSRGRGRSGEGRGGDSRGRGRSGEGRSDDSRGRGRSGEGRSSDRQGRGRSGEGRGGDNRGRGRSGEGQSGTKRGRVNDRPDSPKKAGDQKPQTPPPGTGTTPSGEGEVRRRRRPRRRRGRRGGGGGGGSSTPESSPKPRDNGNYSDST